jgi:hypothetical protein
MAEWQPLLERPIEMLRERVAEYRRMAETARTGSVKASLLKLADAYEALVRQREGSGDGPE